MIKISNITVDIKKERSGRDILHILSKRRNKRYPPSPYVNIIPQRNAFGIKMHKVIAFRKVIIPSISLTKRGRPLFSNILYVLHKRHFSHRKTRENKEAFALSPTPPTPRLPWREPDPLEGSSRECGGGVGAYLSLYLLALSHFIFYTLRAFGKMGKRAEIY